MNKTRYAFVSLALLALLIGGLSVLFTAHYVHATQAAQQRQGELVEVKLCTTLRRLTVLKPPPGNPGTNPSRAYLQDLHETLAQLAPDLGCR